MAVELAEGELADGGAKDILTAVKTAMLAGLMGLFKAGFVPDDTVTGGDLTTNECGFDGYAQAVTVWTGPFLAADGDWRISTTGTFAKTAGVVVESVGGFFITTSLGDVRWFGVFPTDVPMLVEGNFVQVDIDVLSDLSCQVVIDH